MNTQQTTATIKMIANFNRNIFIPLIGDNENPMVVHNELKRHNARIGFEHVRNLMEGREEMFKDFEVLTCHGYHGQLSGAVASPTHDNRPAPVRKPPVPTAPQSTTQQSSSPQIARGRGREYKPSGEIKPLKRGTVYANLMELLLGGATMKELLNATNNVTAGGVNDVLSWQIKHRGYGLRFEQATGKYFLVLPEGHKGLTYKD